MVAFVYFDAGGTLIDPYPSVGDVYATAGQPHGLNASPGDLTRAFREVWLRSVSPEAQSVLTMGKDEERTHAWWRKIVFAVLERVNFEGDREACYRSFFAAFERAESWKIFEDVQPACRKLRARGIPFGILSNWDYRLPPLLDQLELTPWFHPILVSALEGLAKPDPAFFALAARRVGLAPGEILYVGDRPDLDLTPAKEAGFQARLVDRSDRHQGPEVVRALTDIID